MKKPFLILFFNIIAFIAFSQEYKGTIEKQFLEYTNFLIDKDFTKSVEYINEDFFKIVPKSQMVLLIEKTYNNPDLDFQIVNPKVLEIGSIKKINDQSYVKLRYSNTLKMKFKESSGDTSTIDEKKIKNSQIAFSLEKQFGEGNVKYNDRTEYFEIYSVKNVIATTKDDKNWKFVTIEDKQKPLLGKFIPKELLE